MKKHDLHVALGISTVISTFIFAITIYLALLVGGGEITVQEKNMYILISEILATFYGFIYALHLLVHDFKQYTHG